MNKYSLFLCEFLCFIVRNEVILNSTLTQLHTFDGSQQQNYCLCVNQQSKQLVKQLAAL